MGRNDLIQHLLRELAADRYALAQAVGDSRRQRHQVLSEAAQRLGGKSYSELESLYQRSFSLSEALE